MSELLEDIRKYWTKRAKGYSEYNQGELSGEQREKWRQAILAELPDKPLTEIHLLDVGTGPGFFAIILAEAGIQVTAVDYTEEMLKEAKANAGELSEKIHFQQMDAQNLEFPDETFDAVITRNVTCCIFCLNCIFKFSQCILQELFCPLLLRINENLLRCSFFHNIAIFHEDHFICYISGKSHFMRNNNHCDPFIRDFFHNGKHFTCQLRIECGGRFIKQYDLRTECNGSCDRHALLLPTG